MKILFVIILAATFLSSCYYDNFSEMHPETVLDLNCDTSNITYSGVIAPLLSESCGSNNSCHRMNNSDSHISLATYDDVAVYVSTSQLMSSILHDDVNVKFMPYNGGKLSNCRIRKIQIWIDQGFLNN